MDFEFNTKCVLQGALVVGVWYAASPKKETSDSWLPRPQLSVGSVLFAAALFWLTYVMNAILDVKFGCDHGSFYDQFK